MMDITNPPDEQKICIACSKCCKEVGIYTHPKLYLCEEEEIVNFYETRGFKVVKSGEALILTLKISCPHLTDKGCGIYENRPEVCRRYSGLNDFGQECPRYFTP